VTNSVSRETRLEDTFSKNTCLQETNIIGLCTLSRSVEEKMICLYGMHLLEKAALRFLYSDDYSPLCS
jgi:hypothetical protein